MNDNTENLIERPYQEIVDDILTAVVGGVVNEPILFDLKIDRYPLTEPAREVRKITGSKIDKFYAFQRNSDFTFDSDKNSIAWLEGGNKPDDETLFYVDYYRKESRSPLTDINVGSVTRTLSEAIARELYVVYQQVNQAYLSAFLDTAQGRSLDLVVSILGMVRMTRDFAIGQASFFRDPAVDGSVSIPKGTPLATGKREALFKTSEMRTLQRGQARIDIPIQAAEEFRGEAGKVDAGAISELFIPIAGISRVTNHDPTFLGSQGESDESLRSRAKAALRSIGKGTVASLAQAITEERATLSEIWDPNGAPGRTSSRGSVTLLVQAEPGQLSRLRERVEETRAAGVYTTLVARYIYFKPKVKVAIARGLPAAGKAKLAEEIVAALQGYVEGLASGDAAEGIKMVEAVEKLKGVLKDQVHIMDVMAWRLDADRSNARSTVEMILDAVDSASGDRENLKEKINEAISGAVASTPPTGRRIYDRSLVHGPSGSQATDEEIEEGRFTVIATVNSQKWWLVLDMQDTDLLIEEI
jgi:hypothetical protein